MFEVLINSKDLKSQIIMMDGNRTDKLIYCLAKLYQLLAKQARIEPNDLKDLIEVFLNRYADFEVSMAYSVIAY